MASRNITCIERIKDATFFKNVDAKIEKSVLKDFFLVCNIIPDAQRDNILSQIGTNIIMSVLDNDYSALQQVSNLVPNNMAIDLLVRVSYSSVRERTETSDWYGGYWTWGEGMKHEKFDIDTYIDKIYSCKVLVNQDNLRKIGEISDEKKKLISLWICKSLMAQHNSSTFALDDTINNLSMLVRIRIDETETQINPEKSREILQLNESKVSIHIKRETVVDD